VTISPASRSSVGWVYHELATGHDAQAEMPEALSELLLKIAAIA